MSIHLYIFDSDDNYQSHNYLTQCNFGFSERETVNTFLQSVRANAISPQSDRYSLWLQRSKHDVELYCDESHFFTTLKNIIQGYKVSTDQRIHIFLKEALNELIQDNNYNPELEVLLVVSD